MDAKVPQIDFTIITRSTSILLLHQLNEFLLTVVYGIGIHEGETLIPFVRKRNQASANLQQRKNRNKTEICLLIIIFYSSTYYTLSSIRRTIFQY